MEQIKITDKLTLRQDALRMSVELSKSHAKCVSDTINNAELFANYLQGKSVLPEYSDHEKKITDMLAKMQESFKPNPWIPADSEMKPAKGQWAVCALQYGTHIEYLAMYYDHEKKEWRGGDDDVDNTNHVVAWCPIQPFTQPTL